MRIVYNDLSQPYVLTTVKLLRIYSELNFLAKAKNFFDKNYRNIKPDLGLIDIPDSIFNSVSEQEKFVNDMLEKLNVTIEEEQKEEPSFDIDKLNNLCIIRTKLLEQLNNINKKLENNLYEFSKL